MTADAEQDGGQVQQLAATRLRIGLIVGPTGVGKSAFALELAQSLGAEIVNADSRQFYRGMDIGTAKPSPAERRRVRHHLIDFRAPDEPLDVAGFARLAHQAIADISGRGGWVLVVGGSGLYLRVLCGGIFPGPPASAAVRAELEQVASAMGLRALHAQLEEVDAPSAAWISPNDHQRIVRALEVFHLTGIPLSEHQRRHAFSNRPYDTLTIGLELPREELYAAIDRRFDAMLAAGLVDEVRGLIEAGVPVETAPLCTIGYRQVAAFLRGELDLARAAELAKRDSRRLAKRQLTWFRHEPGIIWLDPRNGIETAHAYLADFFGSGKMVSDVKR
jgi:tRNA dimethylallyltransferase